MAEASRNRCQAQGPVIARLSVLPFTDLSHHPLHIHIHNDDYSRIFVNDDCFSAILALERITLNKKRVNECRRLFVTVRPGVDFSRAGGRALQAGQMGSDPGHQRGAPDDGGDFLMLYCTEKFLTHYRFGVNEEVLAQGIVPFQIDKMVVGVASKAAYDWTQKTLFSTGLLVAVCEQRVLVRSGDVLLVPFTDFFVQHQFTPDLFLDMKVLECAPLNQGILSVQTEIVIVDQTSWSNPLLNQIRTSSSVANDDVRPSAQQDINVFSDFAYLFLQENIIDRKTLHVIEKNETNPDILNNDLVDKSILPVKVVTNVSSWKGMAACDTSFWEMADVHNIVGLSEQTVKKLGLFAGSLLRLQPHTPDNPANKERKFQNKISKDALNQKKKGQVSDLARTVVLKVFGGTDVEQEFLYVLPSLMMNIFSTVSKRHPSEQLFVSLQKFPGNSHCKEERGEPSSSCSTSWQTEMAYASEVHVALIYSPDYSPSANCSKLLKHYFQRPRLVKKGDVVSISTTGRGNWPNDNHHASSDCGQETQKHFQRIPECGLFLEADPGYCSQAGEMNERKKPVVHFKVTHIEPESPEPQTFLVDVQHSVLFQDGATNSYVPVTMTTLLYGDDTVLPPPGQSGLVSELVELLFPFLLQRHVDKECMPSVLVTGPAGCGKSSIMRAVAARLHMHLFQVSSQELCGETPASTEARIKTIMHRATTYAPCIVLVRNLHVFGKAADGSTEDPRAAHAFHEIIHQSCSQKLEMPVIVVATTSAPKQVNSDLADRFLHQVAVEVPSEAERYDMVADLVKSSGEFTKVNITHISQRTAGLVLGDLYALMSHVRRLAHTRIIKRCLRENISLSWELEKDIVAAGISITQDDFEAAIDLLQSAKSDAISAPKIPEVAWSDVGGLASIKAEILDTIQLPLNHPELLAAGLRRSGVLLYGPPGTGKTLLAKAVATECSLNFLSVKGPELINMYVGQSEENVREVFSRARSATPCVIFFDELDSLAPNRGRSGDSGGVMDRVVSQLLAELDGLNKGRDVFVIGATNRPDLLDPALLRPGRFDKLLYLGVCRDRKSQLKIIKALTRKFQLSPGWTLDEVVICCPFNMTGADFYALCSDAMLNAVKRVIELLDNGLAMDQTQVLVDKKDFMDALDTLIPSVSEEELQRYTSIQAAFISNK